jgi:hypothetical protein
MIRILFILLAAVVTCTSFSLPGSNTAYLKCVSESGRTIFNAELQDIIGIVEKAEFTVDKKSLTFGYDDEAYTIFDPKAGVFTLYINGKPNNDYPNHRFIKFYAIPSSFKIISNSNTQQKYQFRAKINGTEPRKNKDLITPEVELVCTLEYEI